ncbi:hypothetical protein D3C84_1287140 [compost metagenome]
MHWGEAASNGIVNKDIDAAQGTDCAFNQPVYPIGGAQVRTEVADGGGVLLTEG